MTSLIHPSSTIGKSVKLGENIKIGPYCNIEGEISIGEGTIIKSHVSITGNTTIGKIIYSILFLILVVILRISNSLEKIVF